MATSARSLSAPSAEAVELTILMPCLNEAETLARCIDKAQAFLLNNNISGEVLIADNGSVDGSQNIAREHGARVVDVPVLGYGAALSHGIRTSRGRYIVMGDSDDSYDFSNIMPFIDKLRDGYDLVMGNRFQGGIAPGAMPLLHKYFGNPVLTFIGRLFFNNPSRDFHCGLRGFKRESILELDLRTTGMEFASEMVVKSALRGFMITEVPTTLSKDGRNRPPHIRSWRDGWRHLRFLLMYSPRWLFIYPGLLLFFVGLLSMAVLMHGAVKIGSVAFDVHTLLLAGVSMIVGSQILWFALIAKHYCTIHSILPSGPRMNFYYRFITLERVLIMGLIITASGIGGIIWSAVLWGSADFGTLDYEWMMRVIVPSSVAIVIGVQTTFGAFLAGIIELAVQPSPSGTA
jgi:glycosyltransferase involved in cell wall biosynthesis